MTHVLFFGNVRRDGQRLAARALYRVTNISQRFSVTAGRNDARSALGETQSHGPANARRRSGYQNHLVSSVCLHIRPQQVK
jgi:hypothetical protein